MIPQKQWRDKGDMMDKRTARKVFAKEFQTSINKIRDDLSKTTTTTASAAAVNYKVNIGSKDKLQVYIRKRPIFPHELSKGEFDVATVLGQRIVIHECLMHATMKEKLITSHNYHSFSQVFDEKCDNMQVFVSTTKPLLQHAIEGRKAVCMMYGQTGSGKSYTAMGFQQFIAEEIFTVYEIESVSISAIEVISSKCFDLLLKNDKHHQAALKVCEDANGVTNLLGLTKNAVQSKEEFMECITRANDTRSTHATHVNNVSSRSHVFYRISIGSSSEREGGGGGELTLLDLAGSERNEDTFYHARERIRESIDINSSHMALKQCVHAMVGSSGVAKDIKHIPYRSSMLTRILKDCLWAESSKAAVIVTLSPISSDTEHTLHALKIGRIMGGWDESSMVTQAKMEVDEYISNIENINTTNNIPTNNIKTWSNQDVCKWLSQVQEGRFQKYLINVSSSVDGRQLLRFGLPRFNQICNGDLVDAEIIYNELKSLQKKERVKKK